MNACIAVFFSSVPLLTHQACRVSTIHIATIQHECNFSPPQTASHFILLSLFSSCFLQLERAVRLDKHSNVHGNTVLQLPQKCTETIKLFVNSSCSEVLNSAMRSHALRVQHDQSFENSRFFLTGLESLQIGMNLISCLQSCKHKLTHWVKLQLEGYSNIGLQTFVDVRMWVSPTTTVRVNTIDGSSTIFSKIFERESLLFPCEWIKVCTVRPLRTNFGHVR